MPTNTISGASYVLLDFIKKSIFMTVRFLYDFMKILAVAYFFGPL